MYSMRAIIKSIKIISQDIGPVCCLLHQPGAFFYNILCGDEGMVVLEMKALFSFVLLEINHIILICV